MTSKWERLRFLVYIIRVNQLRLPQIVAALLVITIPNAMVLIKIKCH